MSEGLDADDSQLSGPEEGWVSIYKRGKWTHAQVQSSMESLWRSLSPRAKRLLKEKKFTGGSLLSIKADAVTAEALNRNYMWLKPFQEHFASRTPSAYFIADVFLALDRALDGALLLPPESLLETAGHGDGKQMLALVEAAKLRRMLSYVRYLSRQTTNSIFSNVEALKTMVCRKSGDNVPAPDQANTGNAVEDFLEELLAFMPEALDQDDADGDSQKKHMLVSRVRCKWCVCVCLGISLHTHSM